ncbi:hypothetical protein GCM10020331_054610 [Ectobacillus funiculus]
MFETVDGNPIETGYFVTLDGYEKPTKEMIIFLGITSANPVVLGDSAELRWEKKFQTDEWGRILYHDVIIPALKDEEGNIISPEHTESHPLFKSGMESEKKEVYSSNEETRMGCGWDAG